MNNPIASKLLISGSGSEVCVNQYAEIEYLTSLAAMQSNAAEQFDARRDEIWILQHPPVYTQGTACDQQPFLQNKVDLVKTDRGGQITYHGPGQMVVYPLLNLRRFGLGVKSLVKTLQLTTQQLLQEYNIETELQDGAPGVYVAGKKIASLGLRIRRGISYHGLSLNVDMDLAPFSNIDPCGYAGLQVTQLKDELGTDRSVLLPTVETLGWKFAERLLAAI